MIVLTEGKARGYLTLVKKIGATEEGWTPLLHQSPRVSREREKKRGRESRR
jgi:hypothetical protein